MKYLRDTHTRSLFKAITWRACASLATILIVYAFTHKLILSLEVGALEVIVKIALYYSHERLWQVIPLGKKNYTLSEISSKELLAQQNLEG